MAAPNSSNIIRVPSTIVFNGTTLGECRAIEFIPEVQIRPVWAEELASYVDAFYCGEKVTARFVLRYPDSDALSAICPNASGSTFSFNATGSNRGGKSLYASAGTLVITPRYSSHPDVTINQAMLCISETARLAYAWNKEWGLDCVVYGSINGSGASYTVG
jgi:hypothetical protein